MQRSKKARTCFSHSFLNIVNNKTSRRYAVASTSTVALFSSSSVKSNNNYNKVKSAEKGAITSPAYGLTIPERAGTDPGIVCSQRKPKIPNIAKRPLLISEINPRALDSADLFLLKPKGSNKFKGTGWGRFSNVGYFPGFPPKENLSEHSWQW